MKYQIMYIYFYEGAIASNGKEHIHTYIFVYIRNVMRLTSQDLGRRVKAFKRYIRAWKEIYSIILSR